MSKNIEKTIAPEAGSDSKEYLSVEALKVKFKINDADHEGTKVMQNWKEGKQLTEDKYKNAVEQFKSSPAGRR